MVDAVAARRYLALNPAASEVMDMVGLDLVGAGVHDAAFRLAVRSLALAREGVVARFVLCLVATARSDEDGARRLSRELVCLAPDNERSLYCAVWHSPALNEDRDMLFYDPRRETIYTWLLRAYATLNVRPFIAWAIERYFHDRVRPEFLDRVIQFLGKDGNGNVHAPTASNPRQYLMETDFVRFIGETVANNDCLHKMMELGYLPRGEINFLYDGAVVANRAALDLWSGTTRFIDRQTVAAKPAEAYVRLDPLFLPFGNRFYFKGTVNCLVQRMWERTGRVSLIDDSDQDRLRRTFETLVIGLGWKPTDRIVCFHVRENLYDRGNVNNITQKFRNTDPAKFLKALQLLAASGHKILRIGSTGSYVYPAIRNFFDYANSPIRSPEIDLAIMANCSFYFGTESGPGAVSHVFGRPLCVADFAQIAIGFAPGRCVYNPRLFWSKKQQRFLSLKEMVSQPFRYLRMQRTFDEHGIETVENTADEVCAVLREFLTRLAHGSFLVDATYGPNQQRARQVFKRSKIVTNGLICERFLESHSFLLPA